ncbi:class I SAM-dependent methyltransferase [Halobacillus shinanisalinarum]|uniref:Class I SAM-dependent methyltransferase n=1 Tax=Halobacillus shinanisalinarum TaxID=2932258 RepID=A0ABY4GXG1_9BACI|nr:class I SAM-dependent methyltransferase [Halobacillus shinanisalinarum]UOQ92739.1 class I SAM-dependent methyltransferase [Halobacillus shinanisalinarum]
MISQKEYWDGRFKKGKLWGDQPCPSAYRTVSYLEKNCSNSILVPGCGYGRNSAYFAKNGYDVTGVDISHEAIKHAISDVKADVTNLNYQLKDLFSLSSIGTEFDAVFLSNVIHLFLEKDRAKLVQVMDSLIKPNGLFIFTVISRSDSKNFGVGEEVEQNTFLHNEKVLHFYTTEEIRGILPSNYKILEQELHTQTEKDPLGNEEELILWFVVTKNNKHFSL